MGVIWPNMDIEQIQNEENNSYGDRDIHYCIYDDGEGLEIVFKIYTFHVNYQNQLLNMNVVHFTINIVENWILQK